MINLFDKAAKIEEPKSTKLPKKKGLEEHLIGTPLDELAAIDAMIDSLKSFREDRYKQVTDIMNDRFVDETIATRARPKSFRGISDNAEATCEFKKRDSRRHLTEDQMSTLGQYHVGTETVVVTPARPEEYIFNSEIIADNETAKAISEALDMIPSLKGKQVLLHREASEEVTVNVVNDTTFADVARISDPVTLHLIYSIIATTSIKTKITTQDFDVVVGILKKAGVEFK